MSKLERINLIRRFVSDYEIDTQEEIVQRLKEAGIVATQATVSRDMKQLGIIKVPSKTHGYIYGVPKAKNQKTVVVKSRKLPSDSIQSVDSMTNMIHLDVTPGSSALVKRMLHEKFKSAIFSMISDDDSILIVVKDQSMIPNMVSEIKIW